MRKVSLIVTFFISLIISGCSVSNWNVGKTVGESKTTSNEQTPVQTPPSQVTKPKQQNLHVNKIIEAWGSPTKMRKGALDEDIYVWENCKATGLYVDKCDDNGCKTVPETKCCERALITDKDGYVTNLKEAVNNCI